MISMDTVRLSHWMAVLSVGYSTRELADKCRVTSQAVRSWRRKRGNRASIKAASEGRFKDLARQRIRHLMELGAAGDSYSMRQSVIMRWALERHAPGTFRTTVSLHEAARWLTSYLEDAGGIMLAHDIIAEATEQSISRPTLYRAKTRTQVVSNGVQWYLKSYKGNK